MRVTTQKYGQFLVNSPVNFTGTYFADSTDGLEHDSVSRFLSDSRLTPAIVREKIDSVIVYNPNGRVLFDDSVMDKSASKKIVGAVKQYSGNAHHVVMGIGVVNCVYYNPDAGRFYLLDYRIYDIARDGKTKLDHMTDMLAALIRKEKENGGDNDDSKKLFSHVLMDSWYATAELMNKIMDWNKLFVCAIKSNRLFSPDAANDDRVADEKGKKPPYTGVKDMPWGEPAQSSGYHGKLKDLPAKRLVQLFRIVVGSDKTEYIVTNDVTLKTTDDARKESAIRWKIEEFHREMKQLTGIEKCQARKNRSQRNHIAIAILVWIQLKTRAWATGQTIYEVKHNPLKAYVAEQWRHPATVFSIC